MVNLWKYLENWVRIRVVFVQHIVLLLARFPKHIFALVSQRVVSGNKFSASTISFLKLFDLSAFPPVNIGQVTPLNPISPKHFWKSTLLKRYIFATKKYTLKKYTFEKYPLTCALSPLSTLARSRHWTKFPRRATILQTREQKLFSSKETETGRFKIYQETRFNYYFLHLRLEVAFSQTQLLIRWLQFFPYMNMCRIMRLFSVQFSSREQVIR